MPFRRLIAAAVLLLLGIAPAQADIVIAVDKSAQRLTVEVDGATRYVWPVSTGRWGYNTPNGVYRPQRLERQWYSRKYDWSPMPYSIFFNGGYAIHGSYEISRLGRPASHGCIRLHPQNAAVLFALVKANVRNTQIIITGDRPSVAPLLSSRGRPLRATRSTRAARSFEDVFSMPEGTANYESDPRYPRRERW